MSARRSAASSTASAVFGRAAVQQLLALLCIVAVWQAVSGPLINPYYLSNPVAVSAQIAKWVADGTLWPHLAATLITTLLGFGIAAAVAIPGRRH
jgi:ABC-type nitrate/sulfonate/bicarbonate transport system permease component